MKKKKSQKKKPDKTRAKGERRGQGLNIKGMVVRAAIRQGFRMLEVGILAIGAAILGIKISVG